MSAVWKFPLRLHLNQSVEMPADATVLHVAMQSGMITLWALVDPREERVLRTFSVIGTGATIDPAGAEYIGTVMDGPYVWHVFERTLS